MRPRGIPGARGPAAAARPLPSCRAAVFIVMAALSCGAGRALADTAGDDAPGRLDITLEDSIVLALKNNRRLVNARLDRAVERFSLRVAENTFRPHVTIGPYIARTHTDPSTDVDSAGLATRARLRLPTGGELGLDWEYGGRWTGSGRGGVPAQPRHANALTFTFTQPLLRGAGMRVATAPVAIARTSEQINVLALKATVIDIITSVARRYRDYMQAERRVDIRTRSLERARALREVNELLVRTGRMAERDIVQTEAVIAGRELRLIEARSALDAARLALTDILDVDSRTRVRPTGALGGNLDPERVRTGLAHGVETALRHRPDYRAAVLRIENARSRVEVAESGRRWDLSATVSAKFAGDDATAGRAAHRLRSTDYGVRLDLAVPLGRAAADPARQEYERAVADLGKARNDLAEARQRIDIEVANAVRDVERTHREVGLARTARELAERTMEIEEEKLRLGLSSNFRVVAFEDDLEAAQNTELDLVIAYHNALTALDRTLGTTLERWGIAIDDVEGAGAR